MYINGISLLSVPCTLIEQYRARLEIKNHKGGTKDIFSAIIIMQNVKERLVATMTNCGGYLQNGIPMPQHKTIR